MGGDKFRSFLEKNMKYALGTFYVFALGVFILLVFYWVIDKETFYFLDENIHIATNTSYTIDVIGKSSVKTANDVSWSSSDDSTISVDKEGNIQALKQGIVTISAKSKLGLVKRKIRVSASDFIIYSIVFENDRMVMNQDEEIPLNPILNGEKNIRSTLTWTSTNPLVAEVTSDGIVKGRKEGSTYIIAKDEYSGHSAKVRVDVSGKIKVEVSDHENVNDGGDNYESFDHTNDVNVISLAMKPSTLALKKGQQSQLKVSIQPSNATNKEVEWKSSNEAIAKVDQSGKVYAMGEGECIIYAISKDGSKSAFSTVTVEDSIVPLESIKFSTSQHTLSVGEKYTLVPKIEPVNATNQKLTWTSSNSSIASVDSNGIVTAKALGTVEITATTVNRKIAKIKIVVEKGSAKTIYMERISLNYPTSTLALGESYQLKPSYAPQNVSNSNIIYKSSMEEVIAITKEGKMVAKKPGYSIITASSQDGKASTSLLLFVYPTPIKVEGIVLANGVKQIEIGEQFTVSYSLLPPNANGSTIVWNSDNEEIATVSKSGKVTGKKMGMATITATIPNTNIKTSMQVAVVPKDKVIPLNKQSLIVYQKDIVLLEYKKNYSRAMQNFAIDSQGTQKETLYFAYPAISNSTQLTDSIKSSLVRTVVQRIPKANLSSKHGEGNSYMFLNNTGHAQSFAMEQGEMWLNGDGYIAESDGAYWGYYRSLIRADFKANTPTSTFQEKQNFHFTSADGSTRGNPEVGIDGENDMIVIRSGSKVYIYQFSALKKGKYVLLYQFTLADKIDGRYYDRQGHAISNGYYYQYRGEMGSALYIEVYNMVGELVYTRKENLSLHRAEAEGLKIYNNRIFIGVTYDSRKNGRYNNLYYFG